jgi:hypothetical protein
VRLGLLDPPTCVGLRYGRAVSSLRGFSWPPRQSLLALRHAWRARLRRGICLPASAPRPLGTSLHQEADLCGDVPSSLHSTVPEYSPVVHRLRLAAAAKARLTRRGLTFRRKPRVFGACGSHTRFATHAGILTCPLSTTGSPVASSRGQRSPTEPTNRLPSLRWQA